MHVTKGGDYRGGCQKTVKAHLKWAEPVQHTQSGRKVNDMPKVGKKEFPYTPKGMAAAKAAAKKKGVKVKTVSKKMK